MKIKGFKILPIALEPDGTTPSTGSIKHLHDYLSTMLPNSEIGKTELFTEGKETYLMTSVKQNGAESAVYSQLKASGRTFTITKNAAMMCTGNCSTDVGVCRGYMDYGAHQYRCSCSGKCKLDIRILLSPDLTGVSLQVDNNWKD